MQQPEILTDPKVSADEDDGIDSLDRPVQEVMFIGFKNEVTERFDKIEKFIDILKDKENTQIQKSALNVPSDIEIGDNTYKLYGIPPGYRRLMLEKLQKIAELVPKPQNPTRSELADLLQDKDSQTADELAQALLESVSQPNLLSRLMPNTPTIFDLMCEVIQLAFQANEGKPKFKDGELVNPVITIDEIMWGLSDIEGLFNKITETILPIFFTITSVQRALAM